MSIFSLKTIVMVTSCPEATFWGNSYGNLIQLQHHCSDNIFPNLVNKPPIFFVGKAFLCRGPAPTSLQNSHAKNMKSPFGPQRHMPSMPQLYRKCSDMTARVITPPVEGTSDFAGVWKDLNKWKGGKRGSRYS